VKVVVDFGTCASNALCIASVPEVFEVSDDGFLYVLDENPRVELNEKLRMAESNCPTRSISFVEDE
jgi:ferredoxin